VKPKAIVAGATYFNEVELMEFKFNEFEKLIIEKNNDGKFGVGLSCEYDGYYVSEVSVKQLYELKNKLNKFLIENFSEEMNDLESCNGLNIFFEDKK
jgi:hypothetical protein